MPSPILHTTSGYIVYRLLEKRAPIHNTPGTGNLPKTLLLSLGFSMLPDIDSVVGFLAGDFGKYHNNATHSLVVGLLAALFAAAVATTLRSISIRKVFLIAFFSYSAHILLDFLTIGRGVMAFWPLTDERYLFPWPLIYGVRWSDGLLSIRHIWTLISESALAAFLIAATHYWIARNQNDESRKENTEALTGVGEER